MTETTLRVLIVDDSALYRKFVRLVLDGVKGIDVVGTAHNGRAALDKIGELKPDLLTLDLEMPELDGLGVLREIRNLQLPVGAILCSSLTRQGAAATTSALELGAFDFVLKNGETADLETSVRTLRNELVPKIQAFSAARGSSGNKMAPTPPIDSSDNALPHSQPEAVVIGVSTGGPVALSRLLPQLPADLATPVLIVQHMPPLFTRSLADDLNKSCKITVGEAVDGAPVCRGHIWIAPGGKQMKTEYGPTGIVLRVTDDPPLRNCKPSVDYLFNSAAATFGGNVLAIVMTGMGDDGAEGCRELKRRRATILAQEQSSCVVYGMPRAVVEQGLADMVCPLDRLAAEIVRLTSTRSPACR
jgi:two-component system chemotaxis response regulator CheB